MASVSTKKLTPSPHTSDPNLTTAQIQIIIAARKAHKRFIVDHGGCHLGQVPNDTYGQIQ